MAQGAFFETELAQLGELPLEQLKARYLELTGTPLPKFMRRGLMVLAVSHAIQQRALGGLDRDTRKRLDQLVAGIVPTGDIPPAPRNRKIKAGTRMLRQWQGRMHEVVATVDGFVWNGERYRSLSVIARTITGTRWNGWVFFGVKKPAGETQARAPQRVPKRKLVPRTAPTATGGVREVMHA